MASGGMGNQQIDITGFGQIKMMAVGASVRVGFTQKGLNAIGAAQHASILSQMTKRLRIGILNPGD